MNIEAATIPTGEEMARQTAQAKALREARDKLAERARSYAENKDRKGLERMWTFDARTKPEQERVRRRHAELMGGASFTSGDLADVLGVSLKALNKWLSPLTTAGGDTATDHRDMPATAKLLLDRILADK